MSTDESFPGEERLRVRLEGKHVHVVGLGLFGGQVALVRFLHGLGARLCISDRKSAAALRPSLEAIADLDGLEIILDDQLPPDRAADFDFVAPSPAIPPRSPHMGAALAAGVGIVTEIGLFLECCPAGVTAVTGSAGKSTVATLVAEMHLATGQTTWLGGNVGRSLLGDLPRIAPSDIVVLELSSFQLERLPPGFRPFEVAVLVSLFEHHLDWHGSFQAYLDAKLRVFEGQDAARHVGLRDARPVAVDATPLRGLIMRRNCGLAAEAARARGASEEAIPGVLASFRGLPHRFEEVGRLAVDRAARGDSGSGEVVFINASKATCARTAASVIAVADEPVFAILGGAPFPRGAEEELDALVWACQRTAGRIAIGATAQELVRVVPDADLGEGLEDAVERMTILAIQAGGGTVVLAPGFPSYDAYANFEERGEHFRRVVTDLIERHNVS